MKLENKLWVRSAMCALLLMALINPSLHNFVHHHHEEECIALHAEGQSAVTADSHHAPGECSVCDAFTAPLSFAPTELTPSYFAFEPASCGEHSDPHLPNGSALHRIPRGPPYGMLTTA